MLTRELIERIVEVCATFPTWSQDQVYHYLRQQGVPVTAAQVAPAVVHSGWQRLRHTLHERYELSTSALRLHDAWLVGQLLTQIRALEPEAPSGLARCESTGAALAAVRLPLADVLALAQEAGVTAAPPGKALPWLLRVEQVLPGPWELLTDDQVRYPTCGSTQVGRKSATPRLKKYHAETHQLRELAVHRYYCRNPQCARGSFTNLPPRLTPYSRYRTEGRLLVLQPHFGRRVTPSGWSSQFSASLAAGEASCDSKRDASAQTAGLSMTNAVVVLALQMYAWGYSTYRRTGVALGVAGLTAWAEALLPVAALFGVVKSSGVVGVDEKYVLVPKNAKPAGEMRRWTPAMRVYLFGRGHVDL